MDNKIPPGFCGRFVQHFEKPNPGSILTFIEWLDKRMKRNNNKIAALLDRDCTWLNNVIQIRNQYFHPREHCADLLLRERLIPLLEKQPAWEDYGYIDNNSGKELFLILDDYTNVKINPFIQKHDIEFCEFTGYDPKNDSLIYGYDTFRYYSIRGLWQEIRLKDNALAQPGFRDIQDRSKDCSEFCIRGDHGRGLNLTTDGFGWICSPELMRDSLLDVHINHPESVVIQLELRDSIDIPNAFRKKLRLAAPPEFADWHEWSQNENPIIIGIDTNSLNSLVFIDIILYIIDLSEHTNTSHLKILLAREKNNYLRDIKEDEDLFPEELYNIFVPSSRRYKSGSLISYYHEANNKIGLVGLWDLIKTYFKTKSGWPIAD